MSAWGLAARLKPPLPLVGKVLTPLGVALLCAALLGGLALGTLSGLVPALHSNTLALVVLICQGGIAGLLLRLDPFEGVALLPWVLALLILGSMLTHIVVAILPATFLGIPEDDTLASLLPAQRLAAVGRGAEAIGASVRGAVLGAMLGLPLVVVPAVLVAATATPAQLQLVRALLRGLLVAVVCALVLTQPKEGSGKLTPGSILGATAVVAATVGLGMLLWGHWPTFVPLVDHPLPGAQIAFFALFGGVFAVPSLVAVLLPPSTGEPPSRGGAPSIGSALPLHLLVRSVLAGGLLAWAAGLGNAQATRLSMGRSEEGGPTATQDYLLASSAINTVNALGGVALWWTFGWQRSGGIAALAVGLGQAPVHRPPGDLATTGSLAALLGALLLIVLMAGALALRLGRWLEGRRSRRPSRMLHAILLGYLISGAVLLGGGSGLLLLLCSSLVGMLPLLWRVGRVHLMAILIVPVLLGGQLPTVIGECVAPAC